MKMRLVLLVVGLLMAGVLVAGCGDDEDSGGGGSETSAQTETGGGGETTPPETTTEEGGGSANPNAQQAVESCKQQIGAQPGISEDVKKDLEEICQKAASGDEKDVREATKEVCIKLIEENVPAGPAQDQAKASCEQATTTP